MDKKDKNSLIQQEYKGTKAEELLSNPLIDEFFKQTEDAAARLFLDSPIEDFEKLKSTKEQVEAMKLFRQYLEGFAVQGKAATEMLTLSKDGAFDNL